ncbi:MAG: phage tail fiber protein, partial [Beijerinckiaceae bacterium]
VSGNQVSNSAVVLFGNCTASPGAAVTHFGIGSDVSGAGNLFFKGALSASYQPAIGNAPQFAIGALVTTAD